MNPFQYECTCSICGGPGAGHVKYAGDDWLGGEFTHKNPRVCQSYLALKRAEINTKIKELQELADK